MSIDVSSHVLERAVEVFARGFAFTRSITHPYLVARMGPAWRLRGAPRRDEDYRREEWIACHVAPAEMDRLVRAHRRGRFCLCAILAADEDEAELRAAYRELGYRLHATEPLMVHALKRVPRVSSPAQVRRVTTPALARRLGQAQERRPMPTAHQGRDAPLRQYVALIDGEPVGWVRSIVVDDATWCSDMYVRPEHRRRGIAKALMTRMLRDDRTHGATAAVLTASHTGAHLYESVGYAQVGTVFVYTPRRQ